jgi:hypothetical protein
MAGGKDTEIPDEGAAERGLQLMAARADMLKDTVRGIVGRISKLEADKPWGPTKDFGHPFEQVYQAGNKDGKGGAEFIKQNVTILSEETHKGVRIAHEALQGSVELDHEIADMFRVKAGDQEYTGTTSDDVSTGVDNTLGGIDDTLKKQQDQAKHDQ